MMVGLCRVEWFNKYLCNPFGSDYDEFVIIMCILFFAFYLLLLIFRKKWLFVPSIFFLVFLVEIGYERIIHDDYEYIGDNYVVFLDREKIGVMDCWRNTIITPTYQWYLPCYGMDFENKTKTSSLILCLFCKDDIYYAFTSYEQLIPVERIVLNPKYRKKKINDFINKQDDTIVTLRKKKIEKRKSLHYFVPYHHDENVLGYLMTVKNDNFPIFSNNNATEYHFIYRVGAYLGCGNYYVFGRSEDIEDFSSVYDVYAISKDKKKWDVFTLSYSEIDHYVTTDNQLANEVNRYLDDVDTNLEYYESFVDGICLSNRIKPDNDYYILENSIRP